MPKYSIKLTWNAADRHDAEMSISSLRVPGYMTLEHVDGFPLEETSFREYAVTLENVNPGRKIQTIKCVRAYVPGLGLKEAKDFVDIAYKGHPVEFPGRLFEDAALKFKQELEAEGNEASYCICDVTAEEIEHAKTNLTKIAGELDG